MNKETVKKVIEVTGVYRLYWKGKHKSYSLASVGMDAFGNLWYAPANWLSVPSTDWRRVEKVELIESRPQPGYCENYTGIRIT